MTHPIASQLVLLLVVVGCAGETFAAAQQRYRLDDQGWEQQTQYDDSTPEGQIQVIRRTLAEDQAKQAVTLADAWIKQYPNHPLQVEAYLLRADAKVARRHYYQALFDYEHVIRRYPDSEQFHIALEREYEIANLFAQGMRRRWLGMRLLAAYDEAEEIFIRIHERAPGSDLGEKAVLRLADHYFDRSQMLNAADAYDLFLLNYPRSRHRERAMLRLIQAKLATFKGPRFDGKGLLDAREQLRQFRSEFPGSAERIGADALLVRIDESLALKELLNAQWYQGRGRAVSAVYLYKRVVRDYPQTTAARTAAARLHALGQTAGAPDGGAESLEDAS